MKYLAPLLLSTLLLLPSCGDDEPTTPPPPASPGPLATLLGAPPQVADELRLTFALGLKRAIDDQGGPGTFQRAVDAAVRSFAAEHAGEGHDLDQREVEAFRRVFGHAPADNNPTFLAFRQDVEGVPGARTPGRFLTAEQRAAAGSVRRVAMLGAAELVRLRADAAKLRAAGDDAAADRVDKQITDLDSRLDALAAHLQAQVATAEQGYGELTRVVREATAAPAGSSLESLAARTQLLDETLHDPRPVAERIEALKTNPHGAYHYVPKAEHAELITSMERIEEHRRALAKQDDAATPGAGGEGERPTRRERIYLEAHQSIDAASSVVHMLGSIGAIDDSTRDSLNTGLEVASNVVGLGAAYMTGDITGVISHGAALITMMFGIEPPPDPAEVRHEQVMDALIALGQGQQQIMDMIVSLSEQSAAQHAQVMEKLGLLDDIHAIVTSTHRMVAEKHLEGMRDLRQLLDQRKYHAVAVRDPVTGEQVRRPELGFESYDAMRRHFERNAKRYARAMRFLNDVTRSEELEILRVVTDPKALEEMSRSLGLPVEEVKRPLTSTLARRNATLQFVRRYVDRSWQPVLLGALAKPSRTFDELVERFEALADPAVQAEHRATYERLGLEKALESYYNPLLVSEVVEGHLQLRAYELLVARDGTTLRPESELLAPGHVLLRDLGEDPATRLANFLEPLHGAGELLQKSAAQNALFSGDILIPLLATMGLSRVYGPGNPSPWAKRRPDRSVGFEALRVLAQSPVVRDNAVRFQVHALFHLDAARQRRLQELAGSMMQVNPELRWGPPQATDAELAIVTPETRALARERYAHLLGEVNQWPDLHPSDQASNVEADMRGLDLLMGLEAPRPPERPRPGIILDPRQANAWVVEFRDPGDKSDGYRPERMPLPTRAEIAEGRIRFSPYGEQLAERQGELDRRILAYTLAFADPGEGADTHAHLWLRSLLYAAAMDATP
ncbi:MAG: hypothetical protein H6806_01730 [Planctomycetes bacterium]|nr:hypothetical protein [Planctomycetota bacterium]MCB9828470.1 hypothetical protein [Planctomycetota bacterium]MCB9900237.1 hypothetical protein [Planctomycetota bacterium]